MSDDVMEVTPADEAIATEPDPVRAPPITNRFLFVDVAAQRAKQLRRGARARLGETHDKPFKLERVAMREVELGLVDHEVLTARPTLPAEPAADQA
jgi:DNA-directed RNA polymerase subunit K/omega